MTIILSWWMFSLAGVIAGFIPFIFTSRYSGYLDISGLIQLVLALIIWALSISVFIGHFI